MRIASYNVENLFSRPIVFNMIDHNRSSLIVQKISEFSRLMDQESYSADKARIEELHSEIKDFIFINIRSSEVGRFLFSGESKLLARGRGDWDGFVDLKRERFSSEQVKFTGKVIKTVKADVQCLVEVESADTLKRFNTDVLGSRYSDRIVIDGNDPRGIDIALAATKKFPIVTAKTNIFARDDFGTIFSRDCLEVEIGVPGGRNVFVLINHFKAKDRTPEISDAKRLRQAGEVARILKHRYDLSRDYLIVAGDLNDEPSSAPLAPLTSLSGLSNVLDVVGHPADDRWTYYYGKGRQHNAIDYLFVSDALAPHVRAAGIERRGIYGLERLTGGKQKSFDGIDHWKLAASDHAAIWADLDLA